MAQIYKTPAHCVLRQKLAAKLAKGTVLPPPRITADDSTGASPLAVRPGVLRPENLSKRQRHMVLCEELPSLHNSEDLREYLTLNTPVVLMFKDEFSAQVLGKRSYDCEYLQGLLGTVELEMQDFIKAEQADEPELDNGHGNGV